MLSLVQGHGTYGSQEGVILTNLLGGVRLRQGRIASELRAEAPLAS